ncbi:MAG: hypothetical protein IJS91_04440 [Bacteroidales bacterium]|nr:hypothetical protein [Bacteroidales bacterium]
MRRLLTILVLLLGTGLTSLAAEPDGQAAPFRKRFSLEIGTGLAPLQTQLPGLENKAEAFYNKGQSGNYVWTPAFDLSAVWLVTPRCEIVLSVEIAQRRYHVTQHPEFGTDPYGNPRYDFSQPGTDLGTRGTKPVETLYCQGRSLWLDLESSIYFYSGIGIGVSTNFKKILPVVGLTPLAIRITGDHIYFFAEATISPLGTFGHGGLGWRF